ncbi:MAG: calcium-binding protein, partial [Burkholderiales bacterium]
QYFNLSIGNRDFVSVEVTIPAFDSLSFQDGTSLTFDGLLRRRFFETQFLQGGAGDDTLVGYAGDDFLNGNGGSDTLRGYYGNDTLSGGTGNDLLDGGKGNDILQGQAGEDVYVFESAQGFDLIADFANTEENINVIRWGEDVTPADVVVGRNDDVLGGSLSYDGLSLILNGGTDQVVVGNWFVDGFNKFIRIEFSDGTQWGEAELREKLSVSTEGRDYLVGTSNHDILDGLDGDDNIWGDAGNDTLLGRGGNDHIRGGGGDDFLSGGTGNDTLVGKGGNDVYWFDVGFGKDIVNDFDEDPEGLYGTHDVVRFAPGIAPQDVTLIRDPDTYITLSINNGSDRIFLPAEFVSEQGRIEWVEFADGTVWDETDLFQFLFPSHDFLLGSELSDAIDGLGGNDALAGLGGDDTLIGGWGNDLLFGGPGNDILFGYTGNDILDGGAGNDTLYGGTGVNSGTGNDTYLFGRGYSMDTIYDYFAAGANVDTIRMTAGVLPEDVKVTRSTTNNADLAVRIDGTADELVVKNWFVGDAYKIEQIGFENGTMWDVATIESLASRASNQPPFVAQPIADQDAVEGATFSFILSANIFADFDVGDTLTYSTTQADDIGLPTWLVFDAATRTFSGTPHNGDVGTVSVKVTATDASLASVSDNFNITVANTNDAPQAMADAVSATEGASTGNLVQSLLTNDIDPDVGDTRRISAVDTTLTAGMVSFDALNQTLVYTADAASQNALGAGMIATDQFAYTLIDGEGLGSITTVTVTIMGLNDSPENLTLSANSVAENAPNAQIGTLAAADPDTGDALTFEILPGLDSAQFAILGNTLQVGATGLDFEAGATRNITVRATDSGGLRVERTLTIDVSNVNEAPVLVNAIADRSAAEDSVFSFQVPGNAILDPDAGSALTYSATLADGSPLP